MRTPDIDFVRPSRRLLLGWVAFCVAMFAGASAAMFYWSGRQEAQLKESINLIERRIAAMTPLTTDVVRKEKPVWLRDAEVTIRRDWNPLFDRLEGLNVQGVRLVSLQATALPDGVRAEFELDGWPRVPELNEALNPLDQPERWGLVSVSPVAGAVVPGAVRAIWQR